MTSAASIAIYQQITTDRICRLSGSQNELLSSQRFSAEEREGSTVSELKLGRQWLGEAKLTTFKFLHAYSSTHYRAMKLVIQRVTRASVVIDEKIHSSIGKGLLLLLGIEQGCGLTSRIRRSSGPPLLWTMALS
eukprot:s508_g2.t1